MLGTEALTLVGWSYAASTLAYASVAIFLLLRGRHWRESRASGFLFVAIGLSALWSLFGVCFAVTHVAAFVPASFIADVLRYGAWSGFVISVLQAGYTGPALPARSLARVAAILVGIGVALNAGFMVGLLRGDPTHLASLHLLATTVLTLVLLEQLIRNAASDSRWNVKPLCLGLGGAFIFDLLLFSDTVLFKQIDTDAYAVRGLVHTLVIPLILMSVSRTRDWFLKVRLSQKVVFHSATLTMIGGYLLFMAGVGYYVRSFGGDWGRALQIAVLFAALLGLAIIVFSGSARAKLRVLVGKHFFSYRYDYREEWLRFTHTLSTQNSPMAMGEQVIRGLANLVESPSGVLWLKDEDGGCFAQYSRWNMASSTATEDTGSPLSQFMINSGWVVNLEELRSYPARYADLELPEWVSALPNAWLIVPLMTGNAMIGFVVLGSSRTSLDVNWEINDLLRTAGRQAASFLAQMQATESLLEVRKFDAFNRMSAFVVHDLKNIVTQLSLMLKNAERHSDKPEFQQDMLMTVQHSVERMRQLMLQLREGATPPGTPVGVDLAALLQRIKSARTAQGRELEVEVVESLMTRGHEERIERVIGHLVQNAMDATASGGRVWVKLSREGGAARLEVGDTGHGMTPEFMRERLFKPFQTTKPAGMGIGAYESFQYVQELGGKVAVESTVSVGTTIVLLLPIFEGNSLSDLRQREAA